jgi:hypothetical protein
VPQGRPPIGGLARSPVSTSADLSQQPAGAFTPRPKLTRIGNAGKPATYYPGAPGKAMSFDDAMRVIQQNAAGGLGGAGLASAKGGKLKAKTGTRRKTKRKVARKAKGGKIDGCAQRGFTRGKMR